MLSVLYFRRLVFSHELFLIRSCWHPLLICILCLLRNVLDMGLRLTFVLFFQSLFVVLFSEPKVHFLQKFFSVNPFVPKTSETVLPRIVSLRGTINLVLLCFPVALISIWLPLFLRSV